MFAGRFLWWMITCLAVIILFVTLTDPLARLGAMGLGCAQGRCDYLATQFAASVKPLGLALSFAAIFVCVVLRLAALRFSLLWYPLAAIFFLAATPWLMRFASTGPDLGAMVPVLLEAPPAVAFIAVLVLLFVFPLEEETMPGQGDPLVAATALLAAAGGAVQALFSMPKIVAALVFALGQPQAMPLYYRLSDQVARLFALGTGLPLLAWLLATICAVAALLLIVRDGDSAA